MTVLGSVVLAHSVPVVTHAESREWVVLVGLAILTGSFTVKVPAISARLSVSEAFVFAAVLLYGADVATLIAALDTMVMSLRLRPGARSIHRVLFNMAAGSVAIWTSARLFFGSVGSNAVPVHLSLEQLLMPLAILSLSYFWINSWLIALALSYQRNVRAWRLWQTNFLWLSVNYVGGACVAALLVSYTARVNVTALSIIVPLLVITYLTFRTSMGRLEDANRHVLQLNELYLSTIETLAMAVDAKDQITHGHIRRVQVYAVELAGRLGVTDDLQLRAIEAAALLHDMGKLAIPEHILNKPGRLSSAEFEKMKRHADIGADLLSSIPFPYPVTPIVRHHHENWDGSGYPYGIAGTDIPLGARVLSVVDCFDALTSDRPYRPRLSDDDAFAILKERRGNMYDPLVVDTFLVEYDVIAPLAIKAGQQAKSLMPAGIHEVAIPRTACDEIHAGIALTTTLAEARRAFRTTKTAQQALRTLAQFMRQVTPAHVVAVYVYLPESDVLRCTETAGDQHRALFGLEIANGERTTGWVAANASSIVNSSAALDLGRVCEHFTPTLQSAMSAPLMSAEERLGVLTLYSSQHEPFTEVHVEIAERISALFGEHWAMLNLCAQSTEQKRDVLKLLSA